jgi:spermidine synthase
VLAIALLLSFGSGAAALIYEIVWFQLLELSVGATALSLAIILATFMGGMCLGSLLFPRVVPQRFHPFRIYAVIELSIAALGLLVLFAMPTAASGLAATLILLPPTLLMGATLPALARALESPSWIGFCYGSNIAGGVLGCLIAGFYLLPKYDVTTATYVAASVNLAIAILSVSAAFRGMPCGAGWQPAADWQSASQGVLHSSGRRATNPPQATSLPHMPIIVAIALSGFSALAAESIWTRKLGLLFGGSVYTLSLIVAVFLIGLGLGAAVGSFLIQTSKNPRRALAACQLLGALAIAWASWSTSSLPYWPIDPTLSAGVRYTFELDLVRALWVLLPATTFWGASFPLALAATDASSETVARLYSANTLGAIAGALTASLLLMGWIGSQGAERVIIAVSALAAIVLFPRWAPLAIAASALLIYTIPPISKVLIAHGRFAPSWTGKGDIIFAREGVNSSVAVTDFPHNVRTFHVAGKIQASTVARDMRLQRMLGHLTTLTVEHPKSVLVIGCGAGITAGAVSIDPRVEHETIVEIEALVPQAAAQYFSKPNFDVLHNPKVQVHIEDGRHYVLTTNDHFDGITVDPLDPWVKGAANLYTKEFIQAMRDHLNPGGSVTMYVQLFETTPEAVKSTVATFFAVFPNATIWGNPSEGKGHDMLLLGTVAPLKIDLDAMEQRMDYRNDSPLSRSLEEVGLSSPVDLFATYAGRKQDLREWLQGAPINRDRNLRMSYLAGLGLNLDDAINIYADLLAYREFPEDIFTSSQGRVDSLRRALHLPAR